MLESNMRCFEQKYEKDNKIIIIRIDKADAFEGTEGILFYTTPDMLSGLCGWAFYDTNEPDTVVSMFGSGCSSVVSMT